MIEELKPCPFCGKNPQWSHYTEGSSVLFPPVRVSKWQSSINCLCGIPHVSEFGYVKFAGGNALAQQQAMRRAAASWNRRVYSDIIYHTQQGAEHD